MDPGVATNSGETEAHARLKRLAFVWGQAHGFSACAFEVRLPRSGYRADVAGFRHRGTPCSVVFECKQSRSDLRRDNCSTAATRQRLQTVLLRREILERNLRVHYPTLRISDTLFPEYDFYDFAAIRHRGYSRVMRELNSLHNRLYDCTKFEKLFRYICANLLFLVLSEQLLDQSELPPGWGVLVETNGSLVLSRQPVYQDTSAEDRMLFLQRLAAAATGSVRRELGVSLEDMHSAYPTANLPALKWRERA